MRLYHGNWSPHDQAVAHFKCALSRDRLLRTPDDEMKLLLSRALTKGSTGLASVYVISNDANGLLKIGYADYLKSRFSGLNCGSPVNLQLRHFVHVVDTVIAKRIEGEVHKILAEHRRKGEWFDVSLEVAAAALSQAMLANKVRWWTEQEGRELMQSCQRSLAKHEERQRFFGT